MNSAFSLKASTLCLVLTWVAGALACTSTLAANTNPPPEVVLFPFDDYALPFNSGLLLNLVHGKKSLDKPVLTPGRPGQPDSAKAEYDGTVIRVDDEYRMWYAGRDKDFAGICYAVSRDGWKWEKPSLGLVEYQGSRANNLLSLDKTNFLNGDEALVLYEAEDPNPARRYKMLREVSPSELQAAFSPDGLRWTSLPGTGVIKGGVVEPGGLARINGCYYLNGQGGSIPHPLARAAKRMGVTFLSYDFENWTTAVHLSFRRDPVPPRPPKDFEFHRGEQVHMGASLWNRGNVVLGFYGQYHNETNDRRTSTCDIGLIVSPDGLHFKEPIPDYKLIEGAEESDGADARLLQGQGFENIGDQTLYWYSVWATTPGSPSGVRVATWGRDRLGYFSPAANVENAHCISSVITLAGANTEVFVNADGLSKERQLRVEILTAQLEPMSGFSGKECVPISRSGLRQRVTWNGETGRETIKSPFRVRVTWEGSKTDAGRLYAIYVAN